MADNSEKESSSGDQSLLLTSCSNKRTRTGSENPSSSSSSSSKQSSLYLNDLQVSLIEEILKRLSTTKSVFVCKCVCKNWYSLISSPYFVRRFITHHLNHHCEQNPSAFFTSYKVEQNFYGLFTFSGEPLFKSRGFKLDYLPEKKGSVKVLASFNDLMLCSVNKWNLRKMKYYICNPFTIDWVALPLVEHAWSCFDTIVGFVCEPYYFEDSKGECAFNSNYRFRVVVFRRSEYNQTDHKLVRTYQSETRQWDRSGLEFSDYPCTNVVAYQGKFLWYTMSGNFYAYDPFNPELSTSIDCSYINSTKFVWPAEHYCIGVCQGFLRIVQSTAHGNVKALAIWELKDYATGEWSLVDKVFLDGMILENSLLEKIIDGYNGILRPLGFHPSDVAIVYLMFRNSVISCNTRKGELKMVGKVPGEVETVFSIEPPLWPTPITKQTEVLPLLRS